MASWSESLAREEIPASVLAEAFDTSARAQLVAAYGWFLLEVTAPGSMPTIPPQCCADLPPPTTGKMLPPEIREFQKLESSGWLADLLSGENDPSLGSAAHNNLARAPTAQPQKIEQWAHELELLFERMSDSLDEY